MILTLTASIMYWSLQKHGPYEGPGPAGSAASQEALPEEEEEEEVAEEEEEEEKELEAEAAEAEAEAETEKGGEESLEDGAQNKIRPDHIRQGVVSIREG